VKASRPKICRTFSNRFYRAEKPPTRRNGGSGLGLAIAKSLVDGDGRADRRGERVGPGSCFWFILPRGATP